MVCAKCGGNNPTRATLCAQCGAHLEREDERDSGTRGEKRAVGDRVLAYDWKANAGAISGEGGNRYSFEVGQWLSDTKPALGVGTYFVPLGDVAMDIYVPVGSDDASGGLITRGFITGLLALLLGWLGLQKFYLGYS